MLFKFFSSDISICISLIFALKSSWVELAVPSIVSLSTLNILNFSLWTPFSVVIGHQYWLNLLIMVLVLVSNCFFPNVIDTLPHCQKIYVGERLSLGYISSCNLGGHNHECGFYLACLSCFSALWPSCTLRFKLGWILTYIMDLLF